MAVSVEPSQNIAMLVTVNTIAMLVAECPFRFRCELQLNTLSL